MFDVIPIYMRKIGDETIQTMYARDLHCGLEVGRDFSTWIKDRIDRGQFKQNIDFVKETIINTQSPNRGTGHTGGSPTVEYVMSIDMAKHLALMENNQRGQEYRSRLIEIEKAYRRALVEGVYNTPFDEEGLLTRVGGIVKAIVHKELEQRVPQEVERRMAAERVQLLADCRHIAVSDKSALEYAKEYGAAQKGRRGLVLQLGNALRKICNQRGVPIKQCSRSGVDVFPIEIGDKFMRERGAAIVKDHNDWAFGQNVFKFPPRKRK